MDTCGVRTSGGLLRFAGSHFILFNGENTPAFEENSVFSLSISRDGTLWVAAALQPVADGSRLSAGEAESDFETISEDRDPHSLWAASTRLYHLVAGGARPVTFPEFHGARVHNVFRDAAGTLWIGTDGRELFHLIPHQPPMQFTTANGLVNNFVRGILQGRNGDLWIATDEGVSQLHDRAFHNYQPVQGLAYFSVRSLLEDRAGDLWIGTDHGLSHLHEGRFVQDAATAALRNEKVWAILESPDAALWFGTRANGLFRASPSGITHYTTEQGLASNSVYSLLEDTKGHLWIGGAGGRGIPFREGFWRARTSCRTASSPSSSSPSPKEASSRTSTAGPSPRLL